VLERQSIHRIKLTIEFDGSAFEGWQVQSGGRPSVEAALNHALSKALGHEVKVYGAGRTDSGVHALGMTAHFDTSRSIPPERLGKAASGALPSSVSIVKAEEAAPDFDARRDATMRWYRYQLRAGGPDHPLGPRCWRARGSLDLDAMRAALAELEGDHDFSGFRSSSCSATRTQLTLREASLIRTAKRGRKTGTAGAYESPEPGELLALDFKCRSFLMRMVRMMVGGVVAVGQGKLEPGDIRKILKSGKRPPVVRSVPAEGLCLMAVGYGEAETRSILTDHPLPPSF
jgi:tRNA pseudouridine38-40 synthase